MMGGFHILIGIAVTRIHTGQKTSNATIKNGVFSRMKIRLDKKSLQVPHT